ncbi:MAG TPA: methionine biosynthesis protein MetW [Burkholderiales bacterium]
MVSRGDFAAIAEWVRPRAKILDLGCGDGALLRHLSDTREAWGYGVEIADESVLACVKNGVNIIQSDLESGLSAFESGSFDHVILSQTLQAMRNTEAIVKEMLRVGREGIVSFPNFGHWRSRLQVALGNMPVSDALPYQWFDTPNVHLCTVDDFESFCAQHGIRVLERRVLHRGEEVTMIPNLLGSIAVFRIEARK